MKGYKWLLNTSDILLRYTYSIPMEKKSGFELLIDSTSQFLLITEVNTYLHYFNTIFKKIILSKFLVLQVSLPYTAKSND